MNLNLLKETFANFVRAHGMEHHFRRMAILDMFRGVPVARDLSSLYAQALMHASAMPVDALLRELGSRQDGFTDGEADAIRRQVGPNEIEHEKPLSWWM